MEATARRAVPATPNSTSRVYWNAANGFSDERVTDLPTRFAVDVNADGAGSDFVTVAVLENVSATAGLLNELVAQGNLVLA